MLILNGKKIRDEIGEELKLQLKNFNTAHNLHQKPTLAIIQVGNNKESEAYIKNKKKFAVKCGAEVLHVHLPEESSNEQIIEDIKKLNENVTVQGIITQLPFPKHINRERILEYIKPKKDVDGLGSINTKGLWVNSKETCMPATTRGIVTLLKKHNIEIAGKHVVIIGRSTLVGKPTALAFVNENATVTMCHSETKNIEYHTLAADIIISAAGRPRLITEHHVKPEQIIIDVGITVEDLPEEIDGKKMHKVVGDVDFDEVSKIVHAISPVPGGVGPMTVASLFQNLFDAYFVSHS